LPGFSHLNLRTRWILLSCGFVVASAGSMGGYLVRAAYQALRSESQDGQLVLARSLASDVGQTLAQAGEAVRKLVARPEIRGLQRSVLTRELTLVTTDTELFDSMLLAAPDGRVIATTWPAVDRATMPSLPALTRGLEKGPALDSPVHFDIYWTQNGDPAVCVWAPVIRDRRLVGNLFGLSVLPHHSLGRLKKLALGTDAAAFLMDRDGATLTHRGPGPGSPWPVIAPGLEQATRGAGGIAQLRTQDGTDLIDAFAMVPVSGWRVVVQRPAADCFAPAAAMLKFMCLFLAGAVILAALAAGFAAQVAAGPIESLIRQVRRIENEDALPSKLVVPASSPEIGLLAKALARMFRRLRAQKRARDEAHHRAVEAERQLAESERLASIGQLAAGLAHELNNPLTVILGAAQVLPRAGRPDQRRWSAEIVREAKRCHRLASDLLAFSKPIVIQNGTFSLRGVCREAWQHATVDRKSCPRLALPDKDFTVQGDSQRLHQVLVNLMANAMDAAPRADAVRITWSVSAAKVRVDVLDQGPGFAGDPDTLFRPFYTTKTKGTGLGLSIARSIVRAHGGTLSARSLAPKGACFSLEWPQDQSSREAA
jgi:signal transduction histidine kinase